MISVGISCSLSISGITVPNAPRKPLNQVPKSFAFEPDLDALGYKALIALTSEFMQLELQGRNSLNQCSTFVPLAGELARACQ
jgi:hypothetical protein